MLKIVIEFLSSALAASGMGGGRGRLDTFADRLVKASSEPTLAAAMEHLLRAVNAGTDSIHPPLAARMLAAGERTEIGETETAVLEYLEPDGVQ